MSSLSDRARRSVPFAAAAPRVGIMRGVVPSRQPHVTDVRRNLPTQVMDPVAVLAAREEAVQDGYRAGYEEGLAVARREAEQRRQHMEADHATAIDALQRAAAQLAARQVDALGDVADQAALLALRLAEVVLEHEVATAADPGMDAIARALALVPEEGTIRIRLAPRDLQLLGDVEAVAPGREIQLIGDPQIAPGDCVVQVGATRIDAQISSALARVEEVLR